MRECAVRTSTPLTSRAIGRSSSSDGVPAAITCGKCFRLVFCSTKLMSGCAMSVASRSTAKATPVLPTLICETTSRMNFKLTSAAATPPPVSGAAIVMYGSESLRK